ncbi:hypothetical protein MN608_02434 [Microdochium nivale]|nr:hypothetical protein MN608_02434 [Microdochium nivale]
MLADAGTLEATFPPRPKGAAARRVRTQAQNESGKHGEISHLRAGWPPRPSQSPTTHPQSSSSPPPPPRSRVTAALPQQLADIPSTPVRLAKGRPLNLDKSRDSGAAA